MKIVGNIRTRPLSTSLVADIVWEIDDALAVLGKDFVLQSSTFSFRSQRWRLEMQCVETFWGQKMFHVLSRKGPAPDNNKGTIKWKTGILRSDGSEYETYNGETYLNKDCPMWVNVKMWVGHGGKFLLSEKDILVPEGRLSVFVRLSVEPELKVTEARGFAPAALQTDFEDRSKGACKKKADKEGFAHASLQTDFEDRSKGGCEKKADKEGFAHVSLQTDFEDRSKGACEKKADKEDDAIISEVNAAETNSGNCSHSDATYEVENPGNFPRGSVLRRVASSGNSAQENERPSFENTGATKVLNDICSLWLSGDNSDVVVEVRGVPFRAHRAILSARTPLLYSLFQHHSSEISIGVLLVEDFEPEAFREFLHYVYTGAPLELTAHNAPSVYAVADRYLVDDLKEKCLNCIKDTLCVDSFCGAALLALRFNEEELLQRVTSFFTENIQLILTRVDWQNFVEEHSTWANEMFIKSQQPP